MFSGDKLLADVHDSKSWNELTDVTLKIKYPKSGVGATLTRVDVFVTHGSDHSSAYFSDGGIGQRSATLVVEAKATTSFQYDALFYGTQ